LIPTEKFLKDIDFFFFVDKKKDIDLIIPSICY